MFKEIRYPLISVDDLLEKVRPTKLADPVLYTLALEYHLKPVTYDGPQNQLHPRDNVPGSGDQPGTIIVRSDVVRVTNITPNTIASSNDGTSVTITKTGCNNWDGLCVLQVYPTEQCPVHFTFKIMNTNSDKAGIQLVVHSCPLTSLSAANFGGGVDGSIGNYAKGTIVLSNNNITFTIASKTFKTTKQDGGIYLCVYLYYKGNSVVITIG